MKVLDYLKDNLLIITSNNAKEKIIQRISLEPIFNYKILTIEELKKELFFSYDVDAILYIVNKYNVKPENANEYINSMYFLEDKKYKSSKLNMLLQIKKELEENNYLKKDELFLNIIKNMEVVVYGIDILNKEYIKILQKLPQKYTLISDDIENKISTIYKFDTIHEEINYLLNEISSLIRKGVKPEKIKIANVNSSYEFLLNSYFSMYNLHVNSLTKNKLFYLPNVQNFLAKLKISNDLSQEINDFILTSTNEKINNLLINVANLFVGKDNYLSTLEYKLKSITIPSTYYENEIEIIDLKDNIFTEDEYIFVLSINQGIYPKIYKNEDFLDNLEKKELGIDTSNDKNTYEKESFKILLHKKANMIFSYKLKDSFKSYEKSFVANNDFMIEKKYEFNNKISYSKKQNELELASIYDSIYLPIYDERVSLLNNTYEIPYKKYNNQFIKFDKEKIREYISKNNINLSYSSLDNFYKCGFKYYMANVLKLSTFESSPATEIGNLFHETLQHSDDENFDFDRFYEEKVKDIKEKSTIFYANKLKETLRNIIKINNENKRYTLLTNSLKEKKIEVTYDHPINIKFKGFVDKIMYMIEDDKTYVAIIDYKTGNPDIDVSKVEFGLSMQLPMYLYLLKHTEEFKNVVITGFYLQKLLNDSNKAKDDPYVALANSLKYQGYSNSSLSVISKFDFTYENSKVIKSLKLTKDGNFSGTSKVLSSEEMNEIANKVENKIKEAIEKICDGDFYINPKFLNGENVSCDFCEFKNCCFMNFDNLVYLNNKEKEKQ